MPDMNALLTSCLILSCLLLCSETVPIGMDKTKVKLPEETVEETPQSVVRVRHRQPQKSKHSTDVC